MDAQVILLLQEEEDGVGDGADAQLKGVAVPDELGHVLADAPLHVPDLGGRQLDDGQVGLHDAVQLGDVEESIPQGAGHPLVHLGDDQVGHLGGGFGIVHRDAQADVAVLIGGRDLDHGHVGMEDLLQDGGDLREEHGGEIGPALRGGGPGGGPQEKAIVVEVAVILGLAVLCLAHGHHVDDLHVFILVGVGHHGIQNVGRLAGGVGHHDAVARLDAADGLFRRAAVFLVPGFPIHMGFLLLSPGRGPGRVASSPGPGPAGNRPRCGPG